MTTRPSDVDSAEVLVTRPSDTPSVGFSSFGLWFEEGLMVDLLWTSVALETLVGKRSWFEGRLWARE